MWVSENVNVRISLFLWLFCVFFFFLREPSVLLLLPVVPMMQKCLNIFTSAVRSQLQMFMFCFLFVFFLRKIINWMLLVTFIITNFSIYPHWATLWWDLWVYIKMGGASSFKKEANMEAPKNLHSVICQAGRIRFGCKKTINGRLSISSEDLCPPPVPSTHPVMKSTSYLWPWKPFLGFLTGIQTNGWCDVDSAHLYTVGGTCPFF